MVHQAKNQNAAVGFLCITTNQVHLPIAQSMILMCSNDAVLFLDAKYAEYADSAWVGTMFGRYHHCNSILVLKLCYHLDLCIIRINPIQFVHHFMLKVVYLHWSTLVSRHFHASKLVMT